MNLKFFMLPLLVCLAFTNISQAEQFQPIDIKNGFVNFTYRQMGVAAEGHVQRFEARLNFDPKNLNTAKVSFELDTASIFTESAEANDELAGKDWFDSKAYPKAGFVSDTFKALGNDRYAVTGKISIKDHSRFITTAFIVKPQADISVLEGELTLNRADFGIGSGVWADFGVIANEVQLHYKLPIQNGK